MASPRRIEKVEVLLREVIADALARNRSFPEGTMVTVTRVEASADLYYATIFVTALAPTPEGEREALDLLRRQTGALQHTINRSLRMRPVPRITFAVDQGEKRRERIEKLLDQESGS